MNQLTEPQLRALKEISELGLRRWERSMPLGRAWRMRCKLEALHVIRRGPESQHRYGPVTKRGREVLADAS
jgi:hypothetical protein